MKLTRIKPEVAEKLEAIYSLDRQALSKQGVRNRATVQRIVRVFAVNDILEFIKRHPGQPVDIISMQTQVPVRLAKEILLLLVHREEIVLIRNEGDDDDDVQKEGDSSEGEAEFKAFFVKEI